MVRCVCLRVGRHLVVGDILRVSDSLSRLLSRGDASSLPRASRAGPPNSFSLGNSSEEESLLYLSRIRNLLTSCKQIWGGRVLSFAASGRSESFVEQRFSTPGGVHAANLADFGAVPFCL